MWHVGNQSWYSLITRSVLAASAHNSWYVTSHSKHFLAASSGNLHAFPEKPHGPTGRPSDAQSAAYRDSSSCMFVFIGSLVVSLLIPSTKSPSFPVSVAAGSSPPTSAHFPEVTAHFPEVTEQLLRVAETHVQELHGESA